MALAVSLGPCEVPDDEIETCNGVRVWEPASGKVAGPYGGQVSAAVLTADGQLLIWADATDVIATNAMARKTKRTNS